MIFGEAATIQEILRQGYPTYHKTHPLPYHVRRAVYSQLLCRTKYLGYHAQECPDGHYQKSHYNSCRHRMCPQCGFMKKANWERKQEFRLLNCDYYHLIVTIAHEFNDIWLYQENGRAITDILFQCSKETIFMLLRDKRFLGGTPGITGALHTWSQTQILHIHGHFLITGGGLTPEGEWKFCRNGFLLPSKVAMRIFRTLFRWRLRKAVIEGTIQLPGKVNKNDYRKLLKKTGKKKWNVHVRKRYEHGKGVIKYIARYIRGGSISNSRILFIKDGFVTFRYWNYLKEKKETMRLSFDEFIQRYLLHVPWPNSQRVRYYGLHSSSKKKELNICREQLGQPPVEDPEALDWKDYCKKLGHEIIEYCPVCGQMLLCATNIEARANYPPLKVLLDKAA